MLKNLYGAKNFVISVILTILLPVFSSSSSYSDPQRSTPEIEYPQKGMCYVTWEKEKFGSSHSNESLKKLVSLGVEYISICVTHYQQSFNSTRIKRTAQTPSDYSLTYVIKQAHKLGLKTMIKPHIDLIDKGDGTFWRADIGFRNKQDWEKWFKEYRKIILHYARMAKKLDVEIFCIGTELSFTATKTDKWRNLISETRAIYPGKIVYAANWDNYKNIKFWDDLDYVGINAYFPLTFKSPSNTEDLKKGWEKWKNEIEVWQSGINRPIIFTEIGYPSTSHATYTPWKSGSGGNPDIEVQTQCYEAFFKFIWNQPWLAGVYWWKWDTNVRAGGVNNRQFTPQNKPAQKIIEENYKNDFSQ